MLHQQLDLVLTRRLGERGLELHKFECITLDREFVTFPLCKLEKRNDSVMVLNARATLLVQAQEITVNITRI